MEMVSLTPEQATALLDGASYVQPRIERNAETVHFGIDDIGREFILIVSTFSGVAKLGLF